jgi:hypothetical protein
MAARPGSCLVRWCFIGLAALAAGCSTPNPIPATTQPVLSTIAQPYADGLRRAGINSVQVFANGARVRTATNFGEIYLRYPTDLSPVAFAVYVDASSVEVDSDTYTTGSSAQYEAAIRAILPAAIKATNENNARVITNRFGKN